VIVGIFSGICSGGLVVTQDAGRFAAGTEIVSQVEMGFSKFGLDHVPDHIDSGDMIIAIVSYSEMEQVCVWGNSSLDITADGVVTDCPIDKLCSFDILCNISFVWIEINELHIHNFFHFSGLNAGQEFCGDSGLYARGVKQSTDLFDVSPQLIRASLTLEQSIFTRVRSYWYFQLYSRGMLTVAALFISCLSVYIYMLLRAKKTANSTRVLLLVLNTVQGFMLACVHALGCLHFLTDFCSNDLQIRVWSEFTGLSQFTDLLFVALLQDVIFDLGNISKSKRSSSLCRKMAGAGFVVSDIYFVTFFAYADFTTQLVIGVSFILAHICVLIYVIRTYSKLAYTLQLNCSDVPDSEFKTSAMKLAARFKYYSRHTIVSATCILVASLLYGLGIFNTSIPGYFVHIILLDVGKLLNMYAQTMVLWPIRPPSGRISHSRLPNWKTSIFPKSSQ